MQDTLSTLARRYESYLVSGVSPLISPQDGMLARGQPGALEHYHRVGRSAVDLIARAMLAADVKGFATVLDLPSGWGRVTRHLKAFFPESRLYVGEINPDAREFAATTFAADPICPSSDFSDSPPARYDLVFVGSLVTHFDADLLKRATGWFIAALADNGILVLTTHGRRHDHIERTLHHYIEPAKWESVREDCANAGFGFVETQRLHGIPYGVSWSAPSWLMHLCENDPAVTILGFQEAAWDDHQDALVLQRRPIVR